MQYTDALTTVAKTLSERGKEYGPADECFERSAKIASIVLNKSISKYDVAMILMVNKLARLQESRQNPDHYIDGMGYLAFATQFAKEFESITVAVEDEVRAMASKLTPDYFKRPVQN